MLFDQWLEETRALQIQAFGKDPLALEGEDRIEWIRWNVLAATDELHEMLNETGWKPWATSRHVNEKAAGGELVDVLHFVANLLLAVGWEDGTLEDAYVAKMQKNRDRMASGTYDGLTGKCKVCKRALDDVDTLCTDTECAA